MDKTTNLQLNKPSDDEAYDVQKLNENMDKIDSKYTELEEKTEKAFQLANNGKEKIKLAIIGVDDKAIIPNDPTFEDLARTIETIETGIDTSDATATAGEVLKGKTVYINNEKVTGAMSEKESMTYSSTRYSMVNMLSNFTFNSNMNNWFANETVSYLSTGGYAGGCVQLSRNESYVSLVEQSVSITSGNKYYFACLVKPSSDLGGFYGELDFTNIDTEVDFVKFENIILKQEEWNLISGIATSFVSSENCKARLYINCTSGTLLADNFMLLDLTKVFGTGNEPTKSEMDRIFSGLNYGFTSVTLLGLENGAYLKNTPAGKPMVYTKMDTIVPHVIKEGTNIFGQVGTYTSDGTAEARHIVAGRVCYSKGQRVVGVAVDYRNTSITNGWASNLSKYSTHSVGSLKYGRFTYRLNSGGVALEGMVGNTTTNVDLYNLVAENIKHGVSVGNNNDLTQNVLGTFTSDGTVGAWQMIKGAIGYSQGNRIVGTMEDVTILFGASPSSDAFEVSAISGAAYNDYVGGLDYPVPNNLAFLQGSGQKIRVHIPNLTPNKIRKGVRIGGKNGYIEGAFEGDFKVAKGTINNHLLSRGDFVRWQDFVGQSSMPCVTITGLTFKPKTILLEFEMVVNNYTYKYRTMYNSVGDLDRDNMITVSPDAMANMSQQYTFGISHRLGAAYINNTGFCLPLWYNISTQYPGTVRWIATE